MIWSAAYPQVLVIIFQERDSGNGGQRTQMFWVLVAAVGSLSPSLSSTYTKRHPKRSPMHRNHQTQSNTEAATLGLFFEEEVPLGSKSQREYLALQAFHWNCNHQIPEVHTRKPSSIEFRNLSWSFWWLSIFCQHLYKCEDQLSGWYITV